MGAWKLTLLGPYRTGVPRLQEDIPYENAPSLTPALSCFKKIGPTGFFQRFLNLRKRRTGVTGLCSFLKIRTRRPTGH